MSNYNKKMQQQRLPHTGKVRLPINLWRQAKREARNNNVMLMKKRKKKPVAILKDDRLVEYEKLVRETENEIRAILEDTEILSDIPYDCTSIELLGEIAVANGTETTVYVQRDGLSTLTIVLHQSQPTIANLKRAIETISRVQMKRELRQRNEERFKRRHRDDRCCCGRQSEIATIVGVSEENSTTTTGALCECVEKSCSTTNSEPSALVEPMLDGPTGELVHSAARNGHHHRANVSWRYLWRTYALFNVHTNQPVNDANGGTLLSDCGIENASTVKFCKREKYFGRKRQK